MLSKVGQARMEYRPFLSHTAKCGWSWKSSWWKRKLNSYYHPHWRMGSLKHGLFGFGWSLIRGWIAHPAGKSKVWAQSGGRWMTAEKLRHKHGFDEDSSVLCPPMVTVHWSQLGQAVSGMGQPLVSSHRSNPFSPCATKILPPTLKKTSYSFNAASSCERPHAPRLQSTSAFCYCRESVFQRTRSLVGQRLFSCFAQCLTQ